MTDKIVIKQVKIYPEQRETRQITVNYLAGKMQRYGYNESYPIILDVGNGLIDGGHRLAAARQVGLIEVPYLYVNGNTDRIYHAIRCNEDGADTRPYDVFDYAELCYNLNQGGLTGQEIAEKLGEGWSQPRVVQYQNIKSKLHSRIWVITRNTKSVINDDDALVIPNITNVISWRESHFRALLAHLSNPTNRAIMRAQIKVIKATLARFTDKSKQVTAQWIGNQAETQAWYVKLARYMTDTLVKEIPLSERKTLLKNVYNGVFGDKEDNKNFAKFEQAISALNEKILGIKLYHDDAFQRIPLLKDKSIALIATDPPYNKTDNEWDKIGTDDDYLEFTQKWLEAIQPKLADDYHLFFFCDPDYVAPVEMLLRQMGWPIKSRIIWEYRNLPKGRDATDKFIENWQMCFHCGTHSLNWSQEWDDSRFMVQQHAVPQSNYKDAKLHPTQKPLSLIELLIMAGSKPGDCILDCFAGSGTTGEASKNIGQRRCILIEKNDEFCTIIEKRLGIKRNK